MTEERIKKMLKSRYDGEAWGALIAVTFVGLVISFFGGPGFLVAGFLCGLFFFIAVKKANKIDINRLDYSRLFLIYPNKDVLIKVMDEVVDHPIFKVKGTNISEHFILYGDLYECIIRLCDVVGINNTELNTVYSRIDIEDRFGQKKKIKIETPKAKEIYEYLSENCENAVVGANITFDEGDYSKKSIDYDSELTEEYCFYESKGKKKETKKVIEDKKEEAKEEFKEKKTTKKEENGKTKKSVKVKVNEKKESLDMDKKYDNLKKLKELLDNDIITKEEYEKEKKKILDD